MGEKFLVVGESTTKIGANQIATGKAKYTDDIELPGMLHAKMLGSPYAHARIKRIDVGRAEELPGVVKVVTYKDAPKVPYNPSAWYPNYLEPRDKYVLNERVRYAGEPVAVAAALDEDIAEEALELIEVDYEELPAVFDPEKAMQPGAPKIHTVENNIAGHITYQLGDVERGLKEADYIFEDRYTTSRQAHCAMEPHSCLALYDVGKLTIYSPSQVPFRARRALSDIFNIPINKIRLISYFVGGGFGGKDEVILEPICSLLAIKTERPVKLTLTRDEVFYGTTTRHPCIIELKTGVKRDGTFVARDIKAILDTGAYASHGLMVAGAMIPEVIGLYKSPNLKFDARVVYTNTPIAGAFRGFGNPQQSFAVEQQLDIIAEKLGLDPMEIRQRNAVRMGDEDLGYGRKISSIGLQDCVKNAAERIGWNRGAKVPGKNARIKRGLGMAWEKLNAGAAPFILEYSSAFVKINEDGTVSLLTGAVDMGQGISTTAAQVVAEVIGVSAEDVTVSNIDTDTVPGDRGSYASGTMYIAGEAARRAAEDVKNKLLKAASKVMKVRPEKLEIVKGVIRVKGRPSIKKFIREVMPEEPIISAGTFMPVASPPSYGAHFVEVEVDVETGIVKVPRAVCAHDVGRAINPAVIEGQIEGGFIQGMGFALTEDTLVDEKGKVPNAGFRDYKLFRAREAPNVESIIVEAIGPTECFAAKGIGESAVTPPAPAIANAIYNAVGVRIKELPITGEKIIRALKRE